MLAIEKCLHPWKFKMPVPQQIKLAKLARFRTCKF